MTHIIGDKHDVVTVGYLKFWAERGLIHVEDARDNSYETISIKEVLFRMKAISDMLKHPVTGTESPGERALMYEEREKQQRMLDGLIEVVRKAQVQGSPDDKSAAHALKAARPKSVRMPGLNKIDMEGFYA
jgi:hypothetical protein